MRHVALITISLATLMFFPAQANACQCAEYGTPVCAAYWRADAVFVGELTRITPPAKQSKNELPTALLHFIVEQPFRGVTGAQVDVATLSGTSCDMKFDKGQRYLIYASLDPDTKRLFAGPCTRTTTFDDAAEDLNYLRTVTQQGAQESISGRLVRDKYDPLSGLKVTVQRGDQTIETTTDKQGRFDVSLPGPGNYTVRAFVPFAAGVLAYVGDPETREKATDTLTTLEYELKIEKNHCDHRELNLFKGDLHATAEVTGNVLTTSGRPVHPGFVYLVSADDPDRSTSQQLDENGAFKFEGVGVGDYYLVLNPRNEAPGENDPPYSRTYFPSAAEPAQATRIVVTEDAKLENLTLRVSQPWKERTVSGSVVWQDGRPATGATGGQISLYDADHYVRLIKLDDKGRFNFKVYGDFKYFIEARSWGKTQGRSPRVPIPEGNSKPLKLILKRVE